MWKRRWCCANVRIRERGAVVAERYFDDIEPAIRQSAGCIFLAEAGGEAVGFIGCLLGAPDDMQIKPEWQPYGYICDLYVAEAHRRSGIARRLIEAAERHLAAQGATRITVVALAANAPARATYRGLGYDDYEVTFEKVLASDPRGD
jgi:ribosomal protein S18 acetylase RimI-like enzyme